MEMLTESFEKDRISPLPNPHTVPPTCHREQGVKLSLNKHTQPGGLELGLLNGKGHRFSSGGFSSSRGEEAKVWGVWVNRMKKRAIPASFQKKSSMCQSKS